MHYYSQFNNQRSPKKKKNKYTNNFRENKSSEIKTSQRYIWVLGKNKNKEKCFIELSPFGGRMARNK